MRRCSQIRDALAAIACALTAATGVFGADEATSHAPTSAAPTEAAVALLATHGKRDIRVHDPSTIVKQGDTYWLFATGNGVVSWHSRDLVKWEAGPKVFAEFPAWHREIVPEQKGHLWAPDLIAHGGRYFLYYSVSSFGKNESAIGLVTSPTLDPSDPACRWVDQGVVIQSTKADRFNAIDPSVFRDVDGRLWMSFGSFWDGIMLVELDAKTGKRLAPETPPLPLAKTPEIEAPTLHRRGEYYYLFVNWGLCCRGLQSTYEIRVGRSRSVTGPYLDREGKDLREGGGAKFLSADGVFIGPGHVGILAEDAREWLSIHFYDGTQKGRSTLAIRPLTWTVDGWPVALPAESPVSAMKK